MAVVSFSTPTPDWPIKLLAGALLTPLWYLAAFARARALLAQIFAMVTLVLLFGVPEKAP